MKIKLIGSGEVIEAEAGWGERLIEQGKAVPAAPEKKEPKAEVSVTDKVPEAEKSAEAPKAEAKKAGKKR